MGNRFCRICGEHKPLTLEHIPPRSTGNDHVVVVHRGDEAVLHSLFDMEVRDDDGYRQSHGMTFKTLCEDCNEYLGDNYVETFKGLYLDFAHESGDILDGLDRDRDEFETDGVERYCRFDLNEGFRPLAFVKQVVSNFCATTAPGSMLDCKDFLLDRESTSLPARYRLHMVVLPKLDGESVFSGWMRVLFDDGTFCDMAFIRMPPFGFVLYNTVSSTYLPDRAGDITPMSRMGWDLTGRITLVLPTVTGRNASRPYLWGRYQNAV